MNPDLKVAVGSSEKIKGEDAAQELISQIREKMDKPKFILLFTTIEYKKEFKPLLKTLKKEFPNSPLVGGTVAGFITKEKCTIRGVACFALDYPKLDISIALGKNEKLMPRKAAQNCANKILKNLNSSPYPNKLLINLISGAIIPKIPIIGQINNVNSKLLGDFFSKFGMTLSALIGTGLSKDQDVVDEFSKILPDYHILGAGLMDDGKMISNYLFLDDKVYTNCVIAIGLSTDLQPNLKDTVTVKPTKKSFTVTNTTFNTRIITEIENQPAKKYMINKILGLSEGQFKNLAPFYYKTSDYFPYTFENDPERVIGVGAFLGENVLVNDKLSGNKLILGSVRGQEILTSLENLITNFGDDKPFALIFGSAMFAFILGKRTLEIKSALSNSLKDTPYLMIMPVFENIKRPNKPGKSRVYSFNALTFDT